MNKNTEREAKKLFEEFLLSHRHITGGLQVYSSLNEVEKQAAYKGILFAIAHTNKSDCHQQEAMAEPVAEIVYMSKELFESKAVKLQSVAVPFELEKGTKLFINPPQPESVKDALEKAANLMNPMLRSMIPRGEAYSLIKSLIEPADAQKA